MTSFKGNGRSVPVSRAREAPESRAQPKTPQQTNNQTGSKLEKKSGRTGTPGNGPRLKAQLSTERDQANPQSQLTPRSLWRPERPSITSAVLYVTVTLAVIVGCLSTLRLFIGAGFAYLIAASVVIAIWVPFAFRLARIPWIAGLFASAGIQTWLVLRWVAANTEGLLAPATPNSAVGSGTPTLPAGTLPKVNVESLPRITTTLHRFGTLPPLRIPGDHVSLATAGKLVRDALLQVNAIVAPAPMLVGFGIVVAAVAWIVGTLTEVFLGSFRARFEALLPMSVAAIASALLISHTADPHRIRWVVALGTACALHVVAVAALERLNLSNWFDGSRPRAVRSGVVALAALGLIGVASIRIVERLDLDRRDAFIDWRVSQQEKPSGPTSITSPLASMQRQLLQQSNLEQFRVKALADGQPLASYWRQTSLSKFGAGEEWKGSGSYRRVKTSDQLIPIPDSEGIVLEQEVEIGALPNDQLPAAWEAQSVKVLRSVDSSLNGSPNDQAIGSAGSTTGSASNDDGITIPGQSASATTASNLGQSNISAASGAIPPKPSLSFDEQSLTLLSTKRPRPGQRYQVRSVVRRTVSEEIANAVVIVDPGDPELQLPALPERVKALATRITVSQTSTVAKAKALQDYLRANYSYSLEVPESTVASPLDDFLFESKTGYCVQFAGAFTVLARSIGIPARLALGYTPGKLTEDGYFSVTGKNAHAWPEVRLSDNRWVAFEPTPGRGNPDNEAITGIDGLNGLDGSQTPDNTVASTTTSTTIAPQTDAVPTIPELATPPDAPSTDAKGDSGWQRWLLALLGILVVAGSGLWWLRRRQDATVIVTDRTRRSLRSQQPALQIDALWDRVEHRMAKTVSPRTTQETEIAFAIRARSVAPQITDLALLTQRARYGTPLTVNEADATAAVELAEAIDAELRAFSTNASTTNSRHN